MASAAKNEPGTTARSHRVVRVRAMAALVLGVLLTLFAVLNSQTVRIHIIVTTVSMPLIVAFVVCSVAGLALGWLLAHRRAARSR